MALAFLLGAAVLLVTAAMASLWWLRRTCACGRARWRCDASRLGCWRARSGTLDAAGVVQALLRSRGRTSERVQVLEARLRQREEDAERRRALLLALSRQGDDELEDSADDRELYRAVLSTICRGMIECGRLRRERDALHAALVTLLACGLGVTLPAGFRIDDPDVVVRHLMTASPRRPNAWTS